jgi:hypothetical protein
MRPGTYRLRAFARNATSGREGRTEVRLKLEGPSPDGITGPVVLLTAPRVHVGALSLRGDGEAAGSAVVPARATPAPAGERPIVRGDPIQMGSWTCGPIGSGAGRRRTAYIEQGGVPIYRVPEGWVEGAGRCQKITDLIHTTGLTPGVYTYRAVWKSDAGLSPRDPGTSLTFAITEEGSGLSLAAR